MPRSFSMTMLTWSKGGKAYTAQELTRLLVKTGFVGEEAIQYVSAFPVTTFVVAKKN